MLTIGEFARASGLTAKALRLYDELDLLPPAEVDQSNGYRYYSAEQVEQARLVARLRSAGMPLPRIAAVIGASTPEAAADEVLSYWRQVEADRTLARDVITSLVDLLKGPDNTMNYSTNPGLSLADLVTGLADELPEAGHLERIRAARGRAQTLSGLGDQLVDHFVSEARQGGASWSEISEALGGADQVTEPNRQVNAFARFTAPNRHSIVLAQEAARAHGHGLIGTEHLLLGLVTEPDGLAHDILMAGTGSEQRIRAAIEAAMPPVGASTTQGHIAFGPDSKEAIAQALRAASDLGHAWVGTEHLLLGFIRASESAAAQILGGLGFTSDGLHDEVKRRAAGSSGDRHQ